jgi:hypothetical protein
MLQRVPSYHTLFPVKVSVCLDRQSQSRETAVLSGLPSFVTNFHVPALFTHAYFPGHFHKVFTMWISSAQYLFDVNCVLKLLNPFYRSFRWTAWGYFVGYCTQLVQVRDILFLEHSEGRSRGGNCNCSLNCEGVRVIVV